MPDDRRRPRRRLAPAKPQALVASATLLNTTKMERLPPPEAWANEAWGYYDTVPEVRFACGWLSNAMSRCRIAAASRSEDGNDPVPVVDGPAAEAMDALGGGVTGQAAILADATTHLTVPGIGYLVGEQTPTAVDVGGATWQVLSSDELRLAATPEGKRYEVKTGDGDRSWRTLPADALAVKMWRQHRRWSWKPDSPIRATLPVLRELEALTQHVDASLVSRLAGNGILVLPDEVEFPVAPGTPEDEDPFMWALTQAMITPIGDRDAASAVVPYVIRVPAESVDKIRHITFASPLDEKAQALRDEALRRFASGMDMPAEVIQGLADANHWTAWQIEESAIKLHVEPMLEAICQALTVGYLHPYLQVLGVDAYEDFVVWYDTSDLRVRPDRSGTAAELFDRQAISVEALRRESGFDEDDAPDEDDLRRALLIDIAKSAPTLAPILLPAAGIDLGLPEEPLPTGPNAPQDAPGGDEAPADGPPDRSDSPPPPTQEEAAVRALIAACDGVVFRALERAGARLMATARSERVQWDTNGVPRHELHLHVPVEMGLPSDEFLIDGSLDRVPEIAARHGVDASALAAALGNYTLRLIRYGMPYDYIALSETLGASRGA